MPPINLAKMIHTSRHALRGSQGIVQRSVQQVRPFRSSLVVEMGRRSAKIAGRKGKADAAKAKLYGKIGKLIAQAVRAGGADPIANGRLRDVLAQAKVAQLPTDVIERNRKYRGFGVFTGF